MVRDLNLVVLCGRLASPGQLRVFESGTRLLRLLITVRNAHYTRCYGQTWSSLLSAIGNDIWRRLSLRGGGEPPPRLCSLLLTDLLTDGASRGVIHRHRPSRRIRETPGGEHYWVPTRTNQHPPEATHNPKVAGSNPAPATKETPCTAAVPAFLGLIAWPSETPLKPF